MEYNNKTKIAFQINYTDGLFNCDIGELKHNTLLDRGDNITILGVYHPDKKDLSFWQQYDMAEFMGWMCSIKLMDKDRNVMNKIIDKFVKDKKKRINNDN